MPDEQPFKELNPSSNVRTVERDRYIYLLLQKAWEHSIQICWSIYFVFMVIFSLFLNLFGMFLNYWQNYCCFAFRFDTFLIYFFIAHFLVHFNNPHCVSIHPKHISYIIPSYCGTKNCGWAYFFHYLRRT